MAAGIVVAISGPIDAFAQTISVSSPHRPWFGVSIGKGFVGGDNVEPDDSSDIAAAVDVPIVPTARIRVGAGRLSVNGARFGSFPLRRVTVEALGLVPFPRIGRACQSHFVIGGGGGLYHFGLDNDSTIEPGYQLFAGGECVGSRISAGVQLTGRSIGGPGNAVLPDTKLFSLDMHIFLRVRF